MLEKQFARSDLYLFELLQNAVDDGATVVEFTMRDNVLHVTHNGRPFTPLDVLGLSSVGLSTKSRNGKRTIGFMGVGFKAVYKRYSRVSIDDGTYRFTYQEPPNNKMGYGWVMLPMWQQPPQQYSQERKSNKCHFVLEQPRGGSVNIKRDLLVLPKTAPPLLGRAALVKIDDTRAKKSNKWILDWNGKRHTINRSNITSYSPTDVDASEIISVTLENNKSKITVQNNRWLFVTHRYQPSETARETYHKHTKRSHEGLEEVCGFVPLVMNGSTTQDIPHTLPEGNQAASPSGWVHSVLPTKIRMPVPMHYQGSWLLSVDRQQVQDLADNAWNEEILQQFPNLIATIFRWAAVQKFGTCAHYRAICRLLPYNVYVRECSDRLSSVRQRQGATLDSSEVEILGQKISLQALEQALWSEPILPVGTPKPIQGDGAQVQTHQDEMVVDNVDVQNSISTRPPLSTDYYEGSKSIWVPPSWFEFLDTGFLRGWLGKRPLRTDLMGENAFHPLFGSSQVLTQLNPLPMRTNHLAAELGIQTGIPVLDNSVWKTIRLMAAIGLSYEEFPECTAKSTTIESGPSKSQSKNNSLNSSSENGNQGDNSTNAIRPFLPASIAVWPVFITEGSELASLNEVVLPSSDFGKVPEELLLILRPYFVKLGRDMTSQQQIKFGAFKRDKKDKKDKRSLGPPPPKRIHRLLESAICSVDRCVSGFSAIPEEFENNRAAWNKISTSASSFLTRSRDQFPSQVVQVSTAASNFLEACAALRNLSESEVSAVLQLTKYACETGNHLLLSHVMIDCCSSNDVKLVRSTAAYIGRSLDESGPGADLENFAGHKLQYVSSRYNSIIDVASSTTRKNVIDILVLAGVQTGISVSVSVSSDVDRNKQVLAEVLPQLPDRRLPSLRKNATKADVFLPYGLGHVMNRKKYYILDASLPKEWERLATTMLPASAVSFVSLLLSVPLDGATNITPKSVVAAARCLTGQTEPNAEKIAPLETTTLSKDTPAPLRRRLYFLPPGQPGAKALDISRARLMEQLECLRWLPCSMPSYQDGTLTMLRPREALLEADSSRPDMPVVELPAQISKRLKASLLAQTLTWGTQAPPPPIDELTELVKQAKKILSSDSSLIDKDAVAAIASRMVDTWNAICRSHTRDGLSKSDKNALRILSTLPCVPVKRVLDNGGYGSWIVVPTRCVRMPDSIREAKNEKDRLKQLTIVSLVESDFICDFSHPKHNPFFRQPELSNAVIQLAGICSLEDIQTSVIISVCGSFVRHLCAAEPVLASRSSPLRDAFSYSMNWCLESPMELPKRGQGLKLFVRHGPGIGSKALPARWLPIKGGEVQAVLGDSRVRSALLSPEMNIQLLGVLDHTESDKEGANSKLLSTIDRTVVNALGILRLSDKRFIVKTRARGTPSIVGNASSKLQLVCALLKAMELDRSSGTSVLSTAKNIFLEWSFEPPLMVRHESLNREFQAPGMNNPSSIQLYAMFGRAPKLTKERCILVSGKPDDYSMELEELIFDYVGVRATQSTSQMKHYRAAARLLSHLENDSSFNKFVERDFSDFEALSAWRSLVNKKEVLGKLREAEIAKDRKALREWLIRGEEVFDDDMDGGDSLLQSARDLHSKLEKERVAEVAEQRTLQAVESAKGDSGSITQSDSSLGTREGRGMGRGVDNRPAWMTVDGSADNLSEHPHASSSKEMKPAGPATSSTLETLASSGRGRGISNLPAWMTSSDGPSKASGTLCTPEIGGGEEAMERISAQTVGNISNECGVGRGRGIGRGVDNRPAWMTSGLKDAAETQIPSTQLSAPSSDREAPSPAEKQAKSILSSILESTVEPPEMQDAVGEGVVPPSTELSSSIFWGGRGRGVNNLPSWMTSQDGLSKCNIGDEEEALKKRKHSAASSNLDALVEEDDPPPNSFKKARTVPSQTFRVTLDIDNLATSQEVEFMAWFQSNVKIEIGNRGGSLLNLSSSRITSQDENSSK